MAASASSLTTPPPIATSSLSLDFNRVYTSGATMLLNPIESNSIFIVAAILSASIEYLFEISGDVDSEYYQDLFEVITEETLIFGVVQLTMVFLASLTQLSEAWTIMVQWGMLLMIYMAIWLTLFVVYAAQSNAAWRKHWKQFETVRMNSSANNPDEDEKLYMRCVGKFRVTMKAYGYEKKLDFCDYLGTIEQKQVVKLMDLSWKSWLSMVVTATFNSLRATLVHRNRNEWVGSDLVIPLASYVLLQGFIPTGFFWYIQSTLRRRLQQYLDLGSEGMEKRLQQLDFNETEPDTSRHHIVEPFQPSDLQDPTSFLFWQSLDVTLTLVQIALLQLVWFYSNAVLTIGGNGTFLSSGPAIICLLILCVPAIVLAWKLSWTVTLISILSSLETAANRELLDELCGITKEQRQQEKEEKEAAEKALAIEEENKKRVAEGGMPKAVEELDEAGRVKVQVVAKRPVILDDDFTMSRIRLDQKQTTRMYDQLQGLDFKFKS